MENSSIREVACQVVIDNRNHCTNPGAIVSSGRTPDLHASDSPDTWPWKVSASGTMQAGSRRRDARDSFMVEYRCCRPQRLRQKIMTSPVYLLKLLVGIVADPDDD